MARKRRIEEDDVDFTPRGRPCSPGHYGPPRPQPHEREEYFARLQRIINAVEISELPRDGRLYLQKMLRRRDLLRSIDPKRFPEEGDGVVTLLLRTIAESSNGPSALTLTIIDAVHSCMNDVWTSRGLAWIESFDHVDLVGLHAELRVLGLENQLSRALHGKLEAMLGPPIAPAPPKPKPAPKKLTKPPDVSDRTWQEILALRVADRKRAEQRRKARKAA